ncbi:MAG: hypothetical protein R6V58_14590 [Planctomycetota bacterium]
MGLKKRSAERRKRMVGNVAHSHEEAEEWDLEFWQSLTPQDRLSALVAIRRDVTLIKGADAKWEDGEDD